MKQKFLVAVCGAVMLTHVAFAAPGLTTDQDQLSYVFGLNIGMNFHAQQVAINQAAFTKGLSDGLAGTPPAMTPAQIKDVLTKFQKEMMAKQQAMLKVMAEKNQAAGDSFRKAFAKQKGVIALHDGEILYKVVVAGTGPMPEATDTVNLIYDGKLVDGTVFDSSKRNGDKPVSLPLNHMIPGMQEALLKMPVGSTWQVVISPKVAYGAMGVPTSPIGPNATLVFDLTLKGAAPTSSPATKAPVGK